jgi:hypothetical protein
MAIGDVQVAMQPGHVNSIVRQIKTASIDKANGFLFFAKEAMRRLRLKPDPSAAVKGVPEGSDQCDIQSFGVWTRKITKARKDRSARKQLIRIHATAVARAGG